MKRFRGYTALTITIILTVVLAILGTTLAFVAFNAQADKVAVIMKQTSYNGAQACLEQALLKLTQSSSYAGNETVTVPVGTASLACTIAAITTDSNGNKVIKVTSHATIAAQDGITTLTLTVNPTTLATVSLTESSN